jgi:hypothetical protein
MAVMELRFFSFDIHSSLSVEFRQILLTPLTAYFAPWMCGHKTSQISLWLHT